MKNYSNPPEPAEHAARSPATATRTYARIANASRDDSRRAGGTAPGGTNPATDRDHRWPAVIRAKERRAQDTGADDFLRGVAMGCRGASRRIEIRSREHGGGEARIPAAPDLHISPHRRGGLRTARPRRTTAPPLPPAPPPPQSHAKTTAAAIAALEAQFPWLRGKLLALPSR
jgi:hypothetical protein